MTKATLYMPFYFEWAEILRRLPDAEYGKLVKAILDFAMGEARVPKVSGEARMAYDLITASIARAEDKRVGKALEEASPASERTSPKREKKVFHRVDRTETAENEKRVDSPTSSVNISKNASICDTNRDITSENEKPSATLSQKREDAHCAEIAPSPSAEGYSEAEAPTAAQVAAFATRPSLDDVCRFFSERRFESSPEEFFYFYESNGWLVGQNPMKNWHASALSWEIRAKREGYHRSVSPQSFPSPGGDFKLCSLDANEAFRLALERSYGDLAEDDDDEEDL